MKRLIPGWVHNPGVHCASTAIADVMSFHGHGLGEAMCFGIGCGLGFFYFEGDFLNPTRMTATRSRMLEPRFFENIGRTFSWTIDQDPDHALDTARQDVDSKRPLLLRADIAHLPHYNTGTHFPGHVIAMWGYDDESGVVMIADTAWEGLLEVPYPDIKQARCDGVPYMKNSGEHFAVDRGEPIKDLAPIIRRALIKQADDLFGLEVDMPGLFGFKGMGRAAESLPGWSRAPDFKWCARWFYQVIERRGTGGGAFRLLYSRFLDQACALDPALAEAAPADEMRAIAGAWTELSFRLKEISESDEPRGFEAAAALLGSIKDREEKFFVRVREGLS